MLEKITARNKIVDAVPALRVKVEQLEREIKYLKRVVSPSTLDMYPPSLTASMKYLADDQISAVKVSARKGKGFGKKKASVSSSPFPLQPYYLT